MLLEEKADALREEAEEMTSIPEELQSGSRLTLWRLNGPFTFRSCLDIQIPIVIIKVFKNVFIETVTLWTDRWIWAEGGDYKYDPYPVQKDESTNKRRGRQALFFLWC